MKAHNNRRRCRRKATQMVNKRPRVWELRKYLNYSFNHKYIFHKCERKWRRRKVSAVTRTDGQRGAICCQSYNKLARVAHWRRPNAGSRAQRRTMSCECHSNVGKFRSKQQFSSIFWRTTEKQNSVKFCRRRILSLRQRVKQIAKLWAIRAPWWLSEYEVQGDLRCRQGKRSSKFC